MKMKSLLIHGGVFGDRHTGSVNVPIYQTSTYAQSDVGVHKGYEYSRSGNPTRAALEKLIRDLEGGARGFAFASGMAAITTVFMLFDSGDHIILSDDVYGGTFRVVDNVLKQLGFEYDFVNTSDVDEVKSHIKENTKAVFVETPTNPLMKVTDIREISKMTQNHGLLLIVDNTFMTPYLQQPIKEGANIVLHSATKYLGGHSDLVAGLAVVDSEALGERLHFTQNSTGAVLGPFDSFLLIRGIKTLGVRMEQHCKSAIKIVQWLKNQSWVKQVHYPADAAGNPAHTQMKAPGGMISFEVTNESVLEKVLSDLKLITLAESLGGIESLISVPAKMTHASIPKEKRVALGITDTLIRLSVGIEDTDDLIGELDVSRKP